MTVPMSPKSGAIFAISATLATRRSMSANSFCEATATLCDITSRGCSLLSRAVFTMRGLGP